MKWSSMLKVSAISLSVITTVSAKAGLGEPEIEDLKFGFIKLTDMAPLAVAYKQGFLKTKGYTSRSKRKQTGKCCWTALSMVNSMARICWQGSRWARRLVSEQKQK
ncbi:ABC transporter substrate-binding protein [Vibrio parahaemolyticus]|nr:ABC transporter substrate-binding protein [Vibrio parahaemolyticus]MDN4711374.1 ABC transporter substrate-binding protein [Vibrio parahaemolyticus]